MNKERITEITRIALTISNQINSTIPLSNRLCWGEEYRCIAVHNGLASLEMKVNGFAHTGFVLVCYNEGKDLYDIYTSHNNFSQDYKLVREDVYCDMLGSVLDQVIECDGLSDDEYSKKVHEFFNKIGFDLIIAEDED